MSEARLEHHTYKIKQLIEEYRSGHIVVPEFQRDYVWKKNKAPHLIDSLYRGFPVSSLLLWQSSEDARSRRTEPRPARAGSMNWLIDGQQRVITLSKAIYGDEDIDVVFHPEEEIFVLANAATRKDVNWIRVCDVWDDSAYRRLRRNLDGSRDADRREARLEKLRGVLEYEVPVVRMVEHTFSNAVKAFERINTLGVRLKTEDIQSAQVAARHSGFIADKVSPFLTRVKQEGFTRLNVMHLFRACAFIAKPDGRMQTPLHELKQDEVIKAWKATEKATEQAIGLIRSEFGLVNMDVLWSGALIVPLIAVCANTSPRDRDSKELAGWLALATLCHRYSLSSGTALDQDLRACRSQDPVGALLKNLRAMRTSLWATEKDFSGALADRSGLLALYIACMNKGILDFYSGGKVLLQKNVDRHHILPRGQFPVDARSSADVIANIAFITGDSNKSIGLTGPEVYLGQVKPAVLESQCIPADKSLWRIDQAEQFWRARREALANSFNDFLREALSQRRL